MNNQIIVYLFAKMKKINLLEIQKTSHAYYKYKRKNN